MTTVLTTKQLYSIFLDSDFWINLSRLKRQAVSVCQKCGRMKRLQCHHIRYPDNWFDTCFDDLVVLCRTCHMKEHGLIGDQINPSHKPKTQIQLQYKTSYFIGKKHARRFYKEGKISHEEYIHHRKAMTMANRQRIESAKRSRKERKIRDIVNNHKKGNSHYIVFRIGR